MALFVRQNEERTKLQERLAADLQEKARKTRENQGPVVDGVNDTQYLKGTKQMSGLGWLWVLLLFACIGGVVVISIL